MNKGIKKLFAALMCAVMLTGFAACGKKADEKKEDVPITSTWKFDHMIKNGEEISLPPDETVLIPQFSSDDGKHFMFSVTGTSFFEGNLTKLEDGTYEISQSGDEDILKASIEGDELTIVIPAGEGTTMIFKAVEE